MSTSPLLPRSMRFARVLRRRVGPDTPRNSKLGCERARQSTLFQQRFRQIAAPEHLHWARRFLNVLHDDQSSAFMQLARGSLYVGNDVDRKLRARITAFELGLELGASRNAGNPEPGSLPWVSRSPTAPFVRSSRNSLEMLLHDAIDNHRVVRFIYKRHIRIAEPHVLGLKNGRLQILTWQTGGQSSRGHIPDWRRFFVSELSQVEMTSVTFAGPRLKWGRHSAFDRQIAVVRE